MQVQNRCTDEGTGDLHSEPERPRGDTNDGDGKVNAKRSKALTEESTGGSQGCTKMCRTRRDASVEWWEGQRGRTYDR
jgi:hypothetical protein